MLVLTLYKGSSIFISPDIRIFINEKSPVKHVKLSFEAPLNRAIIREDAKAKRINNNGTDSLSKT